MGKIIFFSIVVALGSLSFYLFGMYKTVPVDPAWELAGSEEMPPGAVTVRFSGTSTLLFSDGDTRVLIDGWFSRPGPLQLAFGKIAPDLQAIQFGLASNEIDSLQAVIPMHSHYDHAMDAPEVARRTGALLMGSESTANIGRGWGLPESKIVVFENRQSVSVGDFVITPIESRHFEFADPEIRERALTSPQIEKPLEPPVSVFDYRLGEAYVFHVTHPRGSFVIVGSAGYQTGALQGLDADVVFLGIGGLGSQTEEYRQSYWQETVDTIGPGRIIFVHYDSLTAPIRGDFRGPVMAMAFLSRGIENLLPFLKEKEAAMPSISFQTLPRYQQVTLFE